MNRRAFLRFFGLAGPAAIVAPAVASEPLAYSSRSFNAVAILESWRSYSAALQEAIARVYFIERIPGETREEFEARRRAIIDEPFASGERA